MPENVKTEALLEEEKEKVTPAAFVYVGEGAVDFLKFELEGDG